MCVEKLAIDAIYKKIAPMRNNMAILVVYDMAVRKKSCHWVGRNQEQHQQLAVDKDKMIGKVESSVHSF